MDTFDAGEVIERFHTICNALDIHFPEEFDWRLNPAILTCRGEKKVGWAPESWSDSYIQRLDRLDVRPPAGFYDIAKTLEAYRVGSPINVMVTLSSYHGLSVHVEADEGSWGAVHDALDQVSEELLAMIEAEWVFHRQSQEED